MKKSVSALGLDRPGSCFQGKRYQRDLRLLTDGASGAKKVCGASSNNQLAVPVCTRTVILVCCSRLKRAE